MGDPRWIEAVQSAVRFLAASAPTVCSRFTTSNARKSGAMPAINPVEVSGVDGFDPLL